ncbi:MAG: YceI family protein [Arcobacter sp.]|nr:YceI family protein [Arcobacter sp.]
MFRRLFLVLIAFGIYAQASNLVLKKGNIIAHTEVFGDSSIDPATKNILASLSMDLQDPTTLKGKVSVSLASLLSDNLKRDSHMQEVLESNKFPNATYSITSVENVNGKYKINGLFELHNVKKNITFNGEIVNDGNNVNLKIHGSFQMSEFGIEPPKLLFLKVRDKVDISGVLELNI